MVVKVAFPITGIVCIGVVVGRLDVVVVCAGGVDEEVAVCGGGVELFEAKEVCAIDEVWGGGAEELAELVDDWAINEVWWAVELFKTMLVRTIADDVWTGTEELTGDWVLSNVWDEDWGWVRGEELKVVAESVVDWALAQQINNNCIIVYMNIFVSTFFISQINLNFEFFFLEYFKLK